MLRITALVLITALVGCQKLEPIGNVQKNEKTETATTESPTPTPTPNPTAKRRPTTPAPTFAGAHILISYKGAMRAKAERTKDEALKLAKELAEKAKKDPSKFAELAKKHSEGPSGPRGGDLGAWPKGRMVPAFDKAIAGLKIGEVSDPVETPFGFHVMIRREPPPLFAGAHILIAYKGAMRARPNVKRSKAEAQTLAKELVQKAGKDPSKFAELAKKHSDGPSGPRGGSLGKWHKGRMVPAFDKAIQGLKMNEVTAQPVETPFGFHVIIRRDPNSIQRQ